MTTTGSEQDIQQARSRSVADILRLQANKNPARCALIYEGREDSFAQLDEVVTRTANALIEQGVGRGDTVAILSHNNRSMVILRFAIIRAGGIFVPINFMLNATEVAYILNHCQARILIAEDALCRTADEAIAQLNASDITRAYLPHTGATVPAGWRNAEGWFEHSDNIPPAIFRNEDEPVQMMYTSGTESRPKGALLSSRSLISQYVSCIIDGGMEETDIELHCLPLYHCAQLDCFLSVDFYLGAKSILLRAPDPAAILAAIETHGITKLFCPPTVWIALLKHPDFETRNLASLSKGYYGASIMPVAVIEELAERLPNMRLWNFYGQTELAPVATILKPGDQLTRLGSAGKPAINVETCIFDDDDRPVAVGEVGEIVHRSPQAMVGYFKDPEKTSAAFRNGWFHSGDLGRFDEDGYLYVVDRKKDMIKSGGENVASREVEEVLFKHEEISEVAVFGLPDPTWIEAVTAVIVPREGMTPSVANIEAFCLDRLAPYKRPKAIYIVDALPKNASGKVLKRELRDQYVNSTQ